MSRYSSELKAKLDKFEENGHMKFSKKFREWLDDFVCDVSCEAYSEGIWQAVYSDLGKDD